MKIITFLSLLLCASLSIQAQNDFKLVAQRDSKSRFYRAGTAVRILFKEANTINEFKGRIDAITADSIFLRHFNSKGSRLGIAVTQLESVRKVRRTARAITGFVAVVTLIHGIALIADDNKNHSDFLDGLEAGLGVTLILLGATTYIVTAATEPVSNSSKSYRFMIVREK